MADISELKGRMDARARQFQKGIERVLKSIVFEVGKEIISDTPQDTGKAASNWKIGINRPADSIIGPHSPGKHLGLGNTQNVNPAVRLMAQKLKGFKLGKRNVIFISNHVSYIKFLDAGVASKQTKPLIVNRGIQRGMKTAVSKLKQIMDKAID